MPCFFFANAPQAAARRARAPRPPAASCAPPRPAPRRSRDPERAHARAGQRGEVRRAGRERGPLRAHDGRRARRGAEKEKDFALCAMMARARSKTEKPKFTKKRVTSRV